MGGKVFEAPVPSFLTIAHRGGGGWRPENTMAAFENALALGCDGAELDVHLTKDGRVVVHHNSMLNHDLCRKRHGGWISKEEEVALAALSYDELLQYEVGEPNPATDYSRTFDQLLPAPKQQIPLLTEVIRLVQERSDDFFLVIELKSPVLQAENRQWVNLVEATLEEVVKTGFARRTIFCSFDWGALIHAKSLDNRIPTWFLTHPLSVFGEGASPIKSSLSWKNYSKLRAAYEGGDAPWYAGFDPRNFKGEHAEAVRRAGGDGWFMHHTDFTAARAAQLKKRNLIAATWSVNLRDPGELPRLVAAGADAHCTDYPEPKGTQC